MGIVGFFTAMLAAISLENVIFSRALGLSGYVLAMNTPKKIFSYGAAYTWIALFSSMGVSLIEYFVDRYELPLVYQAPLLLLAVIVIYVSTYFLARSIFPNGFKTIRKLLPLATFNTALFGVLYLLFESAYTLSGNIGYALGSGIGYTIAMLIILSAKKRLSFSPIPRSFRGVPIMLLYIGILSLAIYGLLGYGLPV